MAIDSAVKRRLALNARIWPRYIFPVANSQDLVDDRASRAKRFVVTNTVSASGIAEMISPLLISPIRIVARG